tara:strand:+ start:271 stop:402 length:132 start_codon:yes stop_codon:yes gene_type:complete
MSTLNPYKAPAVTPRQKTSLEISLEAQKAAAEKEAAKKAEKSE